MTDMLFYAARGFIAEPEKLPRFVDINRPQAIKLEDTRTPKEIMKAEFAKAKGR